MTSRLQSDLLHMYRVQEFGQGQFEIQVPQAVSGAVPFTLVLVGIWSLVVFCLRFTKARKNAITAHSRFGARFRYYLCASGVRYLAPIGIAMTFYAFLLCYVDWFSDSLGYHSLIEMQNDFESAKNFFSSYLKWSGIVTLVVLFAINLLSCVLLAKQRPGNDERGAIAGTVDWLRGRERLITALYRVVSFHGKYLKSLAVLLTTLASLTLFGTQLGEPAKALQLQVQDDHSKYNEVTRRAKAELSESIVDKIYNKIRNTFPPSYLEALKLQTQIDSEVENLQQQPDDAQSINRVNDPDVERILQDEKMRVNNVNRLDSHLRIAGTGRQSVPGDITYNQIEAAKKGLESHPEDRRIELIQVGPKKITLQVEGLASGEIVAMLTQPAIDAIPSLGPLVDALREVVDETTHQPIEEAYDRVIATVIRNPRNLKSTIEREAEIIAAKVDIKTPVAQAMPRAQQQSEELKKRLSLLTEITVKIDHHVTEIPPLPDPRLPPPNSTDRITSGPSNLPKAPGSKPLEHAQEILKELQDRHLSKFRVWGIP